MAIVPESKDWTWVLARPCDECGFDVTALTPVEVAALFRKSAGSWAAVLAQPTVTERPNDHTWSPLEYAAHVRDALGVFRKRLSLMIERDSPLLADWDQDEAALVGRYNEHDPGTVTAELAQVLERAADELESVEAADYPREGTRSDGAAFTVETLARYFAHDVVHHLHDAMPHRDSAR